MVRLISKKPSFSEALDRRWQMGRNNVAIWMAGPLQHLLINVNVVALEKVFFSDTQNPKTVS